MLFLWGLSREGVNDLLKNEWFTSFYAPYYLQINITHLSWANIPNWWQQVQIKHWHNFRESPFFSLRTGSLNYPMGLPGGGLKSPVWSRGSLFRSFGGISGFLPPEPAVWHDLNRTLRALKVWTQWPYIELHLFTESGKDHRINNRTVPSAFPLLTIIMKNDSLSVLWGN